MHAIIDTFNLVPLANAIWRRLPARIFLAAICVLTVNVFVLVPNFRNSIVVVTGAQRTELPSKIHVRTAIIAATA